MLIFEITKTNTPLPQKGLAPILIAPPHTYIRIHSQAMISSLKQSKTNVTHLLRRNKATSASDRRPPWVLSSAGKLIRYLHGSYFLPYRITVSTLDASGAAWQNTIELIKISDAVYTRCVLTQISNDFQRSLCRVQCRQTLAVAAWRPVYTRCKPSFVPQTFFLFWFLSAISIFLSLLGSANFRHVHWWALSPLHHE